MKYSYYFWYFLILFPLNISAFSDIENSDFKGYINNMYEQQLIGEYEDGTFRPNNPVSFIESLKIAINTGDKKEKIIADSNNHWSIPFKNLYNQEDFQNEKHFQIYCFHFLIIWFDILDENEQQFIDFGIF